MIGIKNLMALPLILSALEDGRIGNPAPRRHIVQKPKPPTSPTKKRAKVKAARKQRRGA